MTGAAPQKFGFDRVFDQAGAVAFEPLRTKRVFTAAEVEVIRAEAFAEGQRSESAVADAAAAAALSQIADAAGFALGALAKVAHDHRVHSAELALAAGRKIADAALERFPEAPAAAALEQLAREIESSPKLVVRAAPELVSRLQTALHEVASACGLPGAIVVKDDPSLPMAAFVLDWGDGQAAFDPEQAAARVTAALETALAAEGLHGESISLPNEADHG